MNITTIGIDLAKTVFSIHGTNQHGKVVVRKRLNSPNCWLSLLNCRLA